MFIFADCRGEGQKIGQFLWTFKFNVKHKKFSFQIF